jgi:hypothetical protein
MANVRHISHAIEYDVIVAKVHYRHMRGRNAYLAVEGEYSINGYKESNHGSSYHLSTTSTCLIRIHASTMNTLQQARKTHGSTKGLKPRVLDNRFVALSLSFELSVHWATLELSV